MNKVILIGRIAREHSVSYTAEQKAVLRNSIAVDRGDKDHTADFIDITAFGKTAEFIEKYFGKGSKIAIEGRINTSSYTKEGQKVYTWTVIVDKCEFVEKKNGSGSAEEAPEEDKGFMNIPDSIDEELPFA